LKWLLLALLVILFLLVIILITKVSIYFNYCHYKDNDDLKIEVRFWFGLIKFKVKVPMVKVDDDSPSLVIKGNAQAGDHDQKGGEKTKQFTPDDIQNSLDDWKNLLSHIFGLHKIIRNFLKKVTIKNWQWQTVVGIGDAAHTGMLTGAIWALKGSIIGLVSHYVKMKETPVVQVIPYFQLTVAQTQISCIFQFRIGHAILAGIKLIKFWKGGRPKFKSKPLSALSGDKSKSV